MAKQNPKQSFGKKYGSRIFLLVYTIILTIFFFNTYDKIFKENISLIGDNAAYYILGNAIAQGEDFTNIHKPEKTKHNHFPPGYPVLIAGAIKLFSNDITFIKKVNGFFLFVSLTLLFLIIYNFTGNYHLPFLTVLFSLVNYHLLFYSTIMMSEIPFLCFTLLCIWLFMKVDFDKKLATNWLFFVFIICLSFTYHIRSTGLALMGGLGLCLLFWKKWRYAATLFGGFALLAMPWFLRNQKVGGGSYIDQLVMKNPYRPELGRMELTGWFERFWENFQRYVTREIPSGVLDVVEVESYKEAITGNEWLVGIPVCLVMIFGLIQVKRSFFIIFFYLLGTFGILLLWPEVWFGVRFLLPVIPILTFLFIYGISEFLVLLSRYTVRLKNPSAIYIGLAVVGLLSVKGYSQKSIKTLELKAESPYAKKYQNYFDVARWVKRNAADTAITCSRKGTLFYLYSKGYITGYKDTKDTQALIEDLEQKGVDYVVLEQLGYSSTGRYLYPAIKRYPRKFKNVLHLKDPDTYLFEFHPEWGYTGEFKNDKHHGQGTFKWPNGQKYVGQWRNGKQHGAGTLYLPNGNRLEGNWTNGKLNGEVTVKNANGRIMEKRTYENNKQVTGQSDS